MNKLGAIVLLSLCFMITWMYCQQVPQLKNEIKTLQQQNNNQRQELEDLIRKNTALKNEKFDTARELEKMKNKVNELQEELNSYDGIRILDNFEVTWYNDNGITKSGRKTKDGITAAVDPKVIPLGTWMKIVFQDGTTFIRRADDTGGAVKGRVIDIYKQAPDSTLINLGRERNVTVHILDK